MTLTREQIPERVSALFDGRPTRWAPASNAVGDYDGRARTLEVFEADAREQRELLRRIRDARPELERVISGPLVIVFHTLAETQRLYPEVRAEHYHALAARFAAISTSTSEASRGGGDPAGSACGAGRSSPERSTSTSPARTFVVPGIAIASSVRCGRGRDASRRSEAITRGSLPDAANERT